MARRHWRFIVRDSYGYAIQNALVFVYQPGTSTDFLGTCHDAPSGGSVLTNPFTTNAQGEVQGFFGTEQSIDVFVTDNTDTAYRAVDGPGATISFTSFTEADEIHVTPEDDALFSEIPVVGVTGDLVAAIVNPYTAVTAAMGSVGKWADAAHTHPYVALTPAAPVTFRSVAGAGSTTNPARSDHIHKFMSALGKTSKLTKTTTAEEVLHTLTVPAGTVAAGSMFRIIFRGFQTNSTTAITYTFRARWGGLAGTLLGAALVLVGTTTTHTDNPVHLEFLLTVQSIGASGTITGSWCGDECITTTTANTPKLVVGTQAAAATVDTTADKDLVITAELSSTTGSPNIEVDDILIEQVA